MLELAGIVVVAGEDVAWIEGGEELLGKGLGEDILILVPLPNGDAGAALAVGAAGGVGGTV